MVYFFVSLIVVVVKKAIRIIMNKEDIKVSNVKNDENKVPYYYSMYGDFSPNMNPYFMDLFAGLLIYFVELLVWGFIVNVQMQAGNYETVLALCVAGLAFLGVMVFVIFPAFRELKRRGGMFNNSEIHKEAVRRVNAKRNGN